MRTSFMGQYFLRPDISMSRAAAALQVGCVVVGESRNSVLGILVLEKPTLKEEEGEDGRSKGEGHKDRASRAAIAKSN